MQWTKTMFRKFLDQLRSPGFAVGTALTTLGAVVIGLAGQALQSSLDLPNVAIYLMTGIALICLVFVGRFLESVVTLIENSEKRIEKMVGNPLMGIEKMVEDYEKRIEKMVEKHNYTRFITNKPERLNKMIECIKDAERSIYILSDLSGTEETQLEEHEKYLNALNQVLDNKKVDVKRIVMPNSAGGKSTEPDSDWIYTAPITKAYQKHFKRLQECDDTALSHTNVSRNVSMMIIDNKYLFWKPELMYGDKDLDKLMDGGLYLEDFTQEVTADFAEAFLKMHKKATWTNPQKAAWTKLPKPNSKKS